MFASNNKYSCEYFITIFFLNNILFLGKNTLVILLQLYRLYVVFTENRKNLKKKLKHHQQSERNYRSSSKSKGQNKRQCADDIYTITNEKSSYKNKKRFVG
jgi:hypothetical protein